MYTHTRSSWLFPCQQPLSSCRCFLSDHICSLSERPLHLKPSRAEATIYRRWVAVAVLAREAPRVRRCGMRQPLRREELWSVVAVWAGISPGSPISATLPHPSSSYPRCSPPPLFTHPAYSPVLPPFGLQPSNSVLTIPNNHPRSVPPRRLSLTRRPSLSGAVDAFRSPPPPVCHRNCHVPNPTHITMTPAYDSLAPIQAFRFLSPTPSISCRQRSSRSPPVFRATAFYTAETSSIPLHAPSLRRCCERKALDLALPLVSFASSLRLSALQ